MKIQEIIKAIEAGRNVEARLAHFKSWVRVTRARKKRGFLEVSPDGKNWFEPATIRINSPKTNRTSSRQRNPRSRRNPGTDFIVRGLDYGGTEYFYTGRTGEGWISTDKAAAFRYSEQAAAAKAKLFNRMTPVHGLRFTAERYASNPRGRPKNPRARTSSQRNPGGREEIYPELVAIAARKDPREPHHCDAKCRAAGHIFEHRFKRGAAVYGSPDGRTIIIERRRT